MKYFIALVVLIASSFSFIPSVHASYVLPYPSYMPGNKLYRISRYLDVVKGWWSWGNIAQMKYHLSLADKYLVEAKTLFEYRQYLLALDALVRSDEQVSQIPSFIEAAKKEGKEMRTREQTFREAMTMHRTILQQIQSTVPKTFAWEPEYESVEVLRLYERLAHSYELR